MSVEDTDSGSLLGYVTWWLTDHSKTDVLPAPLGVPSPADLPSFEKEKSNYAAHISNADISTPEPSIEPPAPPAFSETQTTYTNSAPVPNNVGATPSKDSNPVVSLDDNLAPKSARASPTSIPSRLPEDGVTVNAIANTPPPEETVSKALPLEPPVRALSPDQSLPPPVDLPAINAPNSTQLTDFPQPQSLLSASSQPSNLTSTPPTQPFDVTSQVAPAIEQPPTSNLRSSPHPLPADSETAHQIKRQKQDQDLANDSELADGLSRSNGAPIERKLTPSPESVQEAVKSDDAMDVSFDQLSGPSEPTVTSTSVPAVSEAEAHPLNVEAPTGTLPAPVQSTVIEDQPDQPMADAPSVPFKTTRDREDEDTDMEPAAKRTKTASEAESSFKVPDLPQTTSSILTEPTNGIAAQTGSTSDNEDSMTDVRYGFMKKQIQSLKKLKAATHFKEPVDHVKLNLPSYPEIVKNPVALSNIDEKLKARKYSRVSEVYEDLDLMVTNCTLFNGPDHPIAADGRSLRKSFDQYMSTLPPASTPEASRQDKKAQKTKEQPTRSVPVRKPVPPPAAPARSPTGGESNRFALNPDGVPIIRRDSTTVDGRPKRAIHPPKRRGDIGGARPKKKKFETQLKFCQHVLSEISKTKHWTINQYFLYPVDPVALNIPNYHSIIKKPMDLDTMQKKLNDNQYEKAKDFEEDLRLIFKNCYKFNIEGDGVYIAGQQLERLFEELWSGKDEYIDQHEPVSGSRTPGGDSEESEEEEEEDEEADDSEVERQHKLVELQKQIEMMSKHMSELTAPKKKKKPTPPAPTKKGSKSSKPTKKESKTASVPSLGGAKKDKKATKARSEKERVIRYEEKQYISQGISSLNEAQMMEALKIIQTNVPHLKNVDESEIELDIDELPNAVLLKLLNFLKKHIPQPPPEPANDTIYTPSAAPVSSSRPKKNKPMSKHEQETRIEELSRRLNTYSDGNGPQNPSEPGMFSSTPRDSHYLTSFQFNQSNMLLVVEMRMSQKRARKIELTEASAPCFLSDPASRVDDSSTSTRNLSSLAWWLSHPTHISTVAALRIGIL